MKTDSLLNDMETGKTEPKKIVFIVNPISGRGRQKSLGEILARETAGTGIQTEVIMTTHPGHAEELSREAVVRGVDIVVAVGGDGTVNEVARGLVGTSTAMGIIPTGSGNGLAHHLHIPFHFRKSIRIILRGKRHTIDTGTLNGRLFVSVAGVGFDAYVAKKFARIGTRGFHTYAQIVVPAYFGYKQRKYVISANGKEYTRKALFISFANSNQFGNNASVDPVARLDDGFIDICIVKKIPWYRLVFITPAFFLKQFHKTSYVEIFRATEFQVTRARGKDVHLDGDPWKTDRKIMIKVLPLSLNVIIP